VSIWLVSKGPQQQRSTTRATKLKSIITDYLAYSGKQLSDLSSSSIAYLVNLDAIASVSPVVAKGILQELMSQRTNLKLIASENFSSIPTQLAMANLFTDKRGRLSSFAVLCGCENVDLIEETACNLAKNPSVQITPTYHSGADANLVAFGRFSQPRSSSRPGSLGTGTAQSCPPRTGTPCDRPWAIKSYSGWT
jgi:hypothetical protein